MKAEHLIDWLRAVGVPPEVVSVGAEADDCWCLLRVEAPEGDSNEPGWEVFWREQGNRYDWARFTNEQVACFYLFGRLTWTQAVRRVITVHPTSQPATPQPGQPVPPAGPSAVPPAGRPVPQAAPSIISTPGAPLTPGQQQPDIPASVQGMPTPPYGMRPLTPPPGRQA